MRKVIKLEFQGPFVIIFVFITMKWFFGKKMFDEILSLN